MQDLQQTINMVLDYVRAIWLKKRYIIICSWLICPIGFIYTLSLPDVYKSEAQVFVDTRSMLQPILAGLTIRTNPEQEIQMMAKTLKSRENIETIAREADLDITVTTDEEYNQLISKLTSQINLVSTGRENIYTIRYQHERPEMARTVVQETLDLFVEGSLGNNRRDTDSANRFLEEQIAEYENRLAEAEQRLADFQRQYNDILPLQGTFYSKVQNFQSQLEKTQLEMKELAQQKAALERQSQGRGVTSDSLGVTKGQEENIIRTRFDDRILGLESNLDQLKLRFTDKHPDVIETKALLDNLKAAREKEISAFLSADPESGDSPVSNLDRTLKIEVGKIEGRLASLAVREADFIAKIEELQSKIDLVPQIEAEATSLNRDYGITKSNYEQLLRRRESAEISRRADVSSEDLQFRIIKPPLVPNRPSGPTRLIFYTGFLILGFGVGIGISFLISLLNPILVRGQQLSEMTGFPIWGVVTHLELAKVKRTNKFRIAVFLASSGGIIGMYAILVTADILNIKLAERILML
jgi:polysaccharide chain length determinant protein (PEP-CTERM system associated)